MHEASSTSTPLLPTTHFVTLHNVEEPELPLGVRAVTVNSGMDGAIGAGGTGGVVEEGDREAEHFFYTYDS